MVELDVVPHVSARAPSFAKSPVIELQVINDLYYERRQSGEEWGREPVASVGGLPPLLLPPSIEVVAMNPSPGGDAAWTSALSWPAGRLAAGRTAWLCPCQ